MSRIESSALSEIESRGAAARIKRAENRLLDGIERHGQHAIKRRGGDPLKGKLSGTTRKNIYQKMESIAEANRAP